MNKFDVVQKISLSIFPDSVLKKQSDPYQILKEIEIIKGDWHPYYFNWGRNALYALFQQLPFKIIHFPAFTCPVLTDAAKAAGKEVSLLEVDKTYNISHEHLPQKNPECLVAVHTFGNPLDIKALRKKYPSTYIIEDCAHALFAKINNRFVGNDGDAVLFSLYKQIPNLNGSLLLTKKPLTLKQHDEALTRFWPRILFKTAGIHHVMVNKLRKGYINTLKDNEFDMLTSIHPLIANLFVKGLREYTTKVTHLLQIRKWYTEAVAANSFMDSQYIQQGVVPAVYNYTVKLKPEFVDVRDKVIRKLRSQAIFLDRLWYNAPVMEKSPDDYEKKYPYSYSLAQSVITLPVSYDLEHDDVKNLMTIMNRTIASFV